MLAQFKEERSCYRRNKPLFWDGDRRDRLLFCQPEAGWSSSAALGAAVTRDLCCVFMGLKYSALWYSVLQNACVLLKLLYKQLLVSCKYPAQIIWSGNEKSRAWRKWTKLFKLFQGGLWHVKSPMMVGQVVSGKSQCEEINPLCVPERANAHL